MSGFHVIDERLHDFYLNLQWPLFLSQVESAETTINTTLTNNHLIKF